VIQLFAASKCDVNEALYEADKALEKFAAAPQECVCVYKMSDGADGKLQVYVVLFCYFA